MNSRIQQGSIRDIAHKLKMSATQVQRLSKEERQKRLDDLDAISRVVPSIKSFCESSKEIEKELIEESEKMIYNIDDDELQKKIEYHKKRILAFSLIYYERYITGQLPKGVKDSTRANQCLKAIKMLESPNRKNYKKTEKPSSLVSVKN